MEGSEQPKIRSAGEIVDSFRRSLPENCVEYMLFVIDSRLGDLEVMHRLELIRDKALHRVEELTTDYIWQREDFRLELRTQEGLSYLHGTTDFGDCIEDEWLVVYMLRELSKDFPGLWIRTSDTDGEFLLVEAAGVLPKWLTPEIDANRVWIHQGQLRIIPLKPGVDERPRSPSLSQALATLASDPASLIHSPFVQAEAFYRLEKYPAQITNSVHYATATLPKKLAAVLHTRPRAIASAADAFYLRDPIAMQRVFSKPGSLQFPCADLVTVSVKFNRVMFAQLQSQQFSPPAIWADQWTHAAEKDIGPGDGSEQALSALELGAKITTGFELLAASSVPKDGWMAKEAERLREGLAERDGKALPTDEEIRAWPDVERHDDQSWLDINLDDLNKTLGGQEGRKHTSGTSGVGDQKTEADLRKMVARFEAFLNDESAGIDGAEVDDAMDEDNDDWSDSGDEDKEVSFDEQQFAQMMREMMGLPADDARSRDQAKVGSTARTGEYQEPEPPENEIEAVMALTESELREHGALTLESQPKEEKSHSMLLRDRPSQAGDPSSSASVHHLAAEVGDEGDESGEEEEITLDYGLAKNLLESFKSQGGLAGPAGNMLGLMGLRLPRDEADDDDDDEDVGEDEGGRADSQPATGD